MFDQVFFHLLHENADAVPTHVFAFIVEVKVLIMHVWMVELDDSSELCLRN